MLSITDTAVRGTCAAISTLHSGILPHLRLLQALHRLSQQLVALAQQLRPAPIGTSATGRLRRLPLQHLQMAGGREDGVMQMYATQVQP